MHPLHDGADQSDPGLPIWVLPICLLLAATACALVLTFTIRLISESPAPATPPTSVAKP